LLSRIQNIKNNLTYRIHRIWNYEYWPFWLFFAPLIPWWLYYSVRAGSLTFFTAANPAIPDGGVFGESKKAILDQLPKEFLPAYFHHSGSDPDAIAGLMINYRIQFPIVIKPDVGERGNAVAKLDSKAALSAFLESQDQRDWIIQEYVEWPIELGIFYYRYPHRPTSGILSITAKEFLSVTGDGRQTLRELVKQDIRAAGRSRYLASRFGDAFDRIPEKEEIILLEPIGNHCRGTTFLNANHRISENLVQLFDRISVNFDGFYLGRFDLRTDSWENLSTGVNLKILELNGVSSESGHIYDPDMNLLSAYRDSLKQLRIVFEISTANMRAGIKPTPLRKLVRQILQHFWGKKIRNTSGAHMRNAYVHSSQYS